MSRRVGEECRRDFGPLPVSRPLFHFTIFCLLTLVPYSAHIVFHVRLFRLPFMFFFFFFPVYMFVISTGVHTTARPQTPSTFSPPWLISASSSLVTGFTLFFNGPVLYFLHLFFLPLHFSRPHYSTTVLSPFCSSSSRGASAHVATGGGERP